MKSIAAHWGTVVGLLAGAILMWFQGVGAKPYYMWQLSAVGSTEWYVHLGQVVIFCMLAGLPISALGYMVGWAAGYIWDAGRRQHRPTTPTKDNSSNLSRVENGKDVRDRPAGKDAKGSGTASGTVSGGDR